MKEKLQQDEKDEVEVPKKNVKFGWKSGLVHAAIFLGLNLLITISDNWEVVNQFVGLHTTTGEAALISGLLSPFVKKMIEYGVDKLTSIDIQWR